MQEEVLKAKVFRTLCNRRVSKPKSFPRLKGLTATCKLRYITDDAFTVSHRVAGRGKWRPTSSGAGLSDRICLLPRHGYVTCNHFFRERIKRQSVCEPNLQMERNGRQNHPRTRNHFHRCRHGGVGGPILHGNDRSHRLSDRVWKQSLLFNNCLPAGLGAKV